MKRLIPLIATALLITTGHAAAQPPIGATLARLVELAERFHAAQPPRSSALFALGDENRCPSPAPRLHRINDQLLATVGELRRQIDAASPVEAELAADRLERLALPFARHYLAPGERLVECRDDTGLDERYRAAVGRMKSNLFSWELDLDALLTDLQRAARAVETALQHQTTHLAHTGVGLER